MNNENKLMETRIKNSFNHVFWFKCRNQNSLK